MLNETKFTFNSQVCTSKVQSERLLALGLKKETADMYWFNESPYEYLDDWKCYTYGSDGSEDEIPAWSLHRLIEMMPSLIWHREYQYSLNINDDGVIYDRMGIAIVEFIDDNLFDNMIACIRWLIEKNHFNKEYLE